MSKEQSNTKFDQNKDLPLTLFQEAEEANLKKLDQIQKRAEESGLNKDELIRLNRVIELDPSQRIRNKVYLIFGLAKSA